MWSLLRLLSVILGNIWVLYIIPTVFISNIYPSAAAETTSPLFQEILLINQRNGENTFKRKSQVIVVPPEDDPPKPSPGFQQIITKIADTYTANEDAINTHDLVQFVTQLERQAQSDEKTDSYPEILGILEKQLSRRYDENENSTTTESGSQLTDEWNLEGKELESEEEYSLANNDSSCLPVDLSDITEDIVDRIAEGVEESLRIADDVATRNVEQSGNNETVETRQLSVYLFQGQYVPEPRLNRFIDGAIRNMGTELRIAVMDPLYFRVLPRGRVELRDKPIQNVVKVNIQRPRPLRNQNGKRINGKRKRRQNKPLKALKPGRFNFNNNILNRRRRQRQRRKQQQQRRKRQKQQQQQLLLQRQKKKQQQIKKAQAQAQKQNRIRRRTIQNVGGGSVSGLSRVTRDGDAEMQLFGNYTLIRSHMKLGPIDLMMQFRTQRGIRRTSATLPVLRVHSVTRVNQEGSEMIDFLLDRPHPETIKVKGKLFPLAERIAKNIFARLFLPESFLVQRVREKAGLALLSKPTE